ncbi:MAG: hypothetical protein R2713_01040 [Ilumatobacteraceae bacterium]
MTRPRLATVWLGGCSGCHMSLLGTDEWLFEAGCGRRPGVQPDRGREGVPARRRRVPGGGAVANEDNLEFARAWCANVRRSSCRSVTARCRTAMTAMRNPLGDPEGILRRVYVDAPDRDAQVPHAPGIVPLLLAQVRPLHQVIDVDAFVPGCPAPAGRIREAIEALLAGRRPPTTGESIRFG